MAVASEHGGQDVHEDNELMESISSEIKLLAERPELKCPTTDVGIELAPRFPEEISTVFSRSLIEGHIEASLSMFCSTI